MRTITLYHNNCREKANVAKYPYSSVIHNADDLRSVVAFDHVSAEFKDNHRKNDYFIKADCTMLDVDNTHSDHENEWITPNDVRNVFPNVAFYVSFSRNHMKEKNGKVPRPKFHLYFVDKEFTDGQAYAQHKERVCAYYPYFDSKAKDIAHFFYGVEIPNVEYFEGEMLLSDFMETVDKNKFPFTETKNYNRIPIGERNNTLHKIALKFLTRWGDANSKAYEQFSQSSQECEQPLPDDEITSIWESALKYYQNSIKSSPKYISPEQYMSANSLKPADYSDVGQTYVFVREYGNIVKYSPSTGYLYYNGKVWIENELSVHRLVQQFTDRQIDDARSELRKAQQAEDESALNKDEVENKKSKDAINHAIKYRSFAIAKRDTLKIKAVLTEAKPMVEIADSSLDANPFMLNTPDGTIDLRSREIHSHTPDDYCTKITNASISVDGEALFSDFLNVITCENKDLENYLQLISGMFAVGAVYQENLVIAYGSGRNGKSTFFNLLAKVLGDYSGNLSAETLTVNSKKNKSPEYAELRGKRLVIAAELQEGMRLDAAIVKKLCSTDAIYAEKKYRAPSSFIPSHTIVLYTNHLPDVGSSDDGTWRRLIVIPFNAVIEPNSDIKNYAEYLFTNAGGAVMSWIIEGAYKFIKADYTIDTPDIVKNAIADYRSANDWLNNYLTECCEIDKSFSQNAGALYENYRAYCKRNGEYPRKSPDFKSALEKAGFVHRRNNKSRYWIGLRLISNNQGFDNQYVSVPQYDPLHTPPSVTFVTEGDGKNQTYDEDETIEF